MLPGVVLVTPSLLLRRACGTHIDQILVTLQHISEYAKLKLRPEFDSSRPGDSIAPSVDKNLTAENAEVTFRRLRVRRDRVFSQKTALGALITNAVVISTQLPPLPPVILPLQPAAPSLTTTSPSQSTSLEYPQGMMARWRCCAQVKPAFGPASRHQHPRRHTSRSRTRSRRLVRRYPERPSCVLPQRPRLALRCTVRVSDPPPRPIIPLMQLESRRSSECVLGRPVLWSLEKS